MAIETSCDETAVAIYESDNGLLSHQVYSQVALHQPYGGVVPELASRDHLRKTLPVIQNTLDAAAVSIAEIQGIVYTKGPGLIGALMVGASLAYGLAYALGVPILGVHHLEAHLMAIMLEEEQPKYPFVALIVSGGHTLLVHVEDFGIYRLLGETLDDAVGEAFDKTASLLGLPYPGGPALAKLAERGHSGRFSFPRPMVNRPGLDFSFSGLKTSLSNCVKNQLKMNHSVSDLESITSASAGDDVLFLDEQTAADIAYAFEEAVVDTLLLKSKRALKLMGLNQLVVVGGVSANRRLRLQLESELAAASVFFPRIEFCTDNAAMVAYTGCQRMIAGEQEGLSMSVKARWPIDQI